MAKGSFARIADIVRSNVNELLDQLEDPEKLVRQAIRDMEEDLERATASVGTAVANQRRLEREAEGAQCQAAEWVEKAEQAVAAGDEEEGRRALQRKVMYERKAEELAAPLEESRATAAQLRQQLHEMHSSLQEARNRQGNLIARYQAAQTGSGAMPSVADIGGNAFADFHRLEQRIAQHEHEFERMRQKVDAVEAQAETQRQMAEEFGQIKNKLQEKEVRAQVEEELSVLRNKKKSK